MATTPCRSLVQANDVQIETLDWGGTGSTVILLGGYANTADFMEGIATRLTHRFHVLGVNRRAHGSSDQPESGYDIPTLASDLVGVLDAREIASASFIGHSFAGMEMCELAVRYPHRVDKLVYVDALYRYEESDTELFGANPVPVPLPPPEVFDSIDAYCADFVNRYRAYRRLRSQAWDALWANALEPADGGGFREKIRPETAKLLAQGATAYAPDYQSITCPALAIFAFQDETWILPEDADDALRAAAKIHVDRVDREFKRRCIDEAEREVPDLTVIEFQDTSHYCFLDREDETFEAIDEFL